MWSSFYPFDELWALTQLKHEGQELTRVAGVDVSYKDDRYFSALVLFEGRKVADVRAGSGISKEPYTPSLFFLKEAPIISGLIYRESIDLIFVNGHGICHPYSYGLATVVGMTHGIPTVGFARRLTKGEYKETSSGDPHLTYVSQKGVIRAVTIRTAKSKKPVYVSQGFGISLRRTIEEYHRWAIQGRVPEPLRLAHLYAKRHMHESEELRAG